MAFGLLSTGFAAKPLDDIKTDLEIAFQAVFGAGINLEPQSNFGQIIGIMSERYAELWQQCEALYNAAYPDGAEGVNLDNIAAITGSIRNPATKTLVTITATGTPGTILPIGRIVSISTSGYKFVTLAAATIGGGGTITIAAEAQTTGPQPAYAGSVNTIETPVAGWASVTNAADHTYLGTDLETDAAFRLRRAEELRAQGNATVEAIRQDVLGVSGVTEAFVFENTTDLTDVDGLPPHSFETVVQGGTNLDVATAIYESKSAGIATYGVTTQNVTDSQGFVKPIKFTRPTVTNIYVVVNVTRDPLTFPADGVDQIKAAIASYGDANYRIGSDVVSSALIPPCFDISGVLDVPLPLIGLTLIPAPSSSATIAIGPRALADLDTTRITVNLF